MSSTAQTVTEIRPFRVSAPEDELADLRRRIEATRWPDKETDASQGVQLDTIQALAAYWATVPITSTSSSTITAGGLVGHNVPQEVSGAFTDAILEVGGRLR